MVQNYGAGVQACYRGPRLYDTPETKAAVVEVIDWYKRYREILNSDIIHLRRPDAQDWDGIMHVNPQLPQKGFVLLFNPLPEEITREIELPQGQCPHPRAGGAQRQPPLDGGVHAAREGYDPGQRIYVVRHRVTAVGRWLKRYQV